MSKNELEQMDLSEFVPIPQGRGGRRKGAGRKAFGVTKKVSITMPEELWERLDELKEKTDINYSQIFYNAFLNYLRDFEEDNQS